MKFLITSDNHLGYKESDPIRGLDSFVTFEEILQIANSEDVDFIIQGGDLFHNNKPSRFSLNLCIHLLKKYCMGDKEINFESNLKLNYQDPNLNIKIPVIAINGNHDDPCGLGSLSALNILNTCGLINYVGKITNYEKIVIEPVLLRGDQKIAIYVLSHVKDVRLHRAFLTNRVSYLRPDDYEDWYNILVVHQNRIPRREKDFLPEEFLDQMFDLVIYGHEHDTFYYKNVQKGFTMIQVGSSVRTSLCEAESKEKRVYLVENGVIKPIRLNTVRPMVMDQIKVDCENYEEVVKNKIDEMIKIAIGGGTLENLSDFFVGEDISKTFLESDINEFILEEEKENEINGIKQKKSDLNETKSGMIKKNTMLPLIRLKIETPMSITLNRLAMLYKEKVANFDDMLVVTRKAKKKDKIIQNIAESRSEFFEIFSESLKSSQLQVISENMVVQALKKFIDKEERKSFEEMFNSIMKIQADSMLDIPLDIEEIEKKMLEIKEILNQKVIEEEGNVDILERPELIENNVANNIDLSEDSNDYKDFL
ncbi:Double-strand break repair protein MRE11 [Dictyocoela muelleri]|nr:Double-strand break repair protein MRE11 [Dictyocoela muelleri]